MKLDSQAVSRMVQGVCTGFRRQYPDIVQVTILAINEDGTVQTREDACEDKIWDDVPVTPSAPNVYEGMVAFQGFVDGAPFVFGLARGGHSGTLNDGSPPPQPVLQPWRVLMNGGSYYQPVPTESLLPDQASQMGAGTEPGFFRANISRLYWATSDGKLWTKTFDQDDAISSPLPAGVVTSSSIDAGSNLVAATVIQVGSPACSVIDSGLVPPGFCDDPQNQDNDFCRCEEGGGDLNPDCSKTCDEGDADGFNDAWNFGYADGDEACRFGFGYQGFGYNPDGPHYQKPGAYYECYTAAWQGAYPQAYDEGWQDAGCSI